MKLPYQFIISHKPASEVGKRLKTLGYSEDEIRQARIIRRKYKLKMYIKDYRKKHREDILQMKQKHLQLEKIKTELLNEIAFYKEKIK